MYNTLGLYLDTLTVLLQGKYLGICQHSVFSFLSFLPSFRSSKAHATGRRLEPEATHSYLP